MFSKTLKNQYKYGRKKHKIIVRRFPKTKKFMGTRGKLESQYSLRIWPYRIVYFVDKERDVIITDIRHRKDVYR